MGVMRYREIDVLREALDMLAAKLHDVDDARTDLYGDEARTRDEVEATFIGLHSALASVRNAASTARAVIQALDDEQFEEDEAAEGRVLPAGDDGADGGGDGEDDEPGPGGMPTI